MTLLQALLLGVIQGITEFLPVSSSGHLAVAQLLIPSFSQPGIVFDTALHVGTVAAVVLLEWRRVAEAVTGGYFWRLAFQLGVATVATVAVALPLRHRAEAAFQLPLMVAAGFVLTALLLFVGRTLGGDRRASSMPWTGVVLVGLVQGVAVFPGVSRSGSTIVAGLGTGLDRRWAADFSFLLSVPAIVGAALVEGWSNRAALAAGASSLLLPSLVGALTAAVVGAGALVVVRRLVLRGRLHLFAFYLLPLAAAVVALTFTGVL